MSVGIIGLGYVGLPLAVAFAEEGVDVVCLDVDQHKLEAIAAGSSYVEDVSSERLAAIRERLTPTSRYVELAGCEAVLIAVPTPLSANREPDLGPLIDAAQRLGTVLTAGQLVVLESTTYPGTTREQLLPLLEESGLAAGRDFNVEECAERAIALYACVCDHVVRVGTPEAAEMAKLLENIFRSVNIALVNELAMLADRMGIDIWEVVDAAATKPYGFMRFEPGPGMGGHCLPVDPFYLSWRAREFDLTTEFIELAGKINQQMPYHCVDRIVRALNEAGKAVKGARIALLGVSYKAGVGDVRESPALKIVGLLQKLGADIVYHDAFVPELTGRGLRSDPFPDVLEGADIAVVVTAHPGIDWELVVTTVPTLVDLRGVTRGIRAEHVIRL
jgi:UDP-N-acetyl-D-glucosamine dehydrogenase